MSVSIASNGARLIKRKVRLAQTLSANATHLNTLPRLVPIPQLYRHIVRARQHQALSWVDRQTSDIVRVRFKARNPLLGIVVVDA
jgi:hypothetical protein